VSLRFHRQGARRIKKLLLLAGAGMVLAVYLVDATRGLTKGRSPETQSRVTYLAEIYGPSRNAPERSAASQSITRRS
jgi:hypothetical protein